MKPQSPLVILLHAQLLPPLRNGRVTDAPMITNRQKRFGCDGADQVAANYKCRASSREGSDRPGNRRVAKVRHPDLAAQLAGQELAGPHTRRMIRPFQKFVSFRILQWLGRTAEIGCGGSFLGSSAGR